MKHVITIVALLLGTLGYGQTTNLSGDTKFSDADVKIESMSIHVEVDSAEEVEATFKNKNIKSILDEVEAGEDISFKITCNGKTMSNGVKSHVSYAVNGNTNDRENFLKSVKKIRKAAIKYYKNKE